MLSVSSIAGSILCSSHEACVQYCHLRHSMCPLAFLVYRLFRVVHAPLFVQSFSSDRSHMIAEDGHWLSPPPPYPCIKALEGALPQEVPLQPFSL